MGIVALCAQFGALTHTKAVLLVGDDQPQIVECGGVGYQRMGADNEVHSAFGDLLSALPLLLGGQRTGQQFAADTKRCQ